MKNVFKNIIQDFHNQTIPKFVNRNITIPINSEKIVTLIGSRRAGKTYLMFQLIKEILKTTKKENIIYINFEDERLNDENLQLSELIDAYLELFPDNKNPIYLLFDEIQNITGWEKFVRRIYDNFTKNIIITGSSSKLLSKEIATSLRGRAISYDIFPLSFVEFLQFHKVDLQDIYSTTNKAKINNLFIQYFQNGGFPETVFMEKEIRLKTLQNYLEVMIYRDIVERYNLTNLMAVKYFIKKAIVNTSNRISINKIFNELKSAGIKISKESIYEYADYSQDCFLLYFVNIYDLSFAKQIVNEKKLYCIDNGLVNSSTFKLSTDFGRLLENLVFLELKRRYTEIFYHYDKYECDFIIATEHEPQIAIQVTHILDEINKKRELAGLLEAITKYKIDEGIILTFDQEDEFIIDEKKIKVIPTWKWLLQNN